MIISIIFITVGVAEAVVLGEKTEKVGGDLVGKKKNMQKLIRRTNHEEKRKKKRKKEINIYSEREIVLPRGNQRRRKGQ